VQKEGEGLAGWEGAMVSVGCVGLAVIRGGGFRLAGLAKEAGGLIGAGRGVGGVGAVEGEAVGAGEVSRGVLLWLLSVPFVLSVAH
jgi:hypothetical protein